MQLAVAVWIIRSFWLISGGLGLLKVLVPDENIPPKLRDAFDALTSRGKVRDKQRDKRKSAGFLAWTVPQSWFAHFYLVGLIWNVIVIALAAGTFAFEHPRLWGLPPVDDKALEGAACVAILILFQVHLTRRFLETVLMMKYSKQARMHCVAWAFGILYYIFVPLSMLHESVLEDVLKHNPIELLRKSCEANPTDILDLSLEYHWWLDPLGVTLFVVGFWNQWRAHKILADLRKGKKSRKLYHVPEGGWFKYVSSPHYFAEIVVYLGLILMLDPSRVTLWLLFTLVVTNLTFAAAETHRWYQSNFPEYPANRKAIFPFVY